MNRKLKEKVTLIAGALVLVALLFSACLFPRWTAETVIVEVTKTERIVTGSGDDISSKYLIFTTAETFENTDSLAYFKFDSSDVQGALSNGRTYTLVVYGWRVPALSWYRNVVRIEKAHE